MKALPQLKYQGTYSEKKKQNKQQQQQQNKKKQKKNKKNTHDKILAHSTDQKTTFTYSCFRNILWVTF